MQNNFDVEFMDKGFEFGMDQMFVMAPDTDLNNKHRDTIRITGAESKVFNKQAP